MRSTLRTGRTDDLPLEEAYFRWLYSFVGELRNLRTTSSYWELTRALHKTEFVFSVRNDVNRDLDGKALRDEFLYEVPNSAFEIPTAWFEFPASVLEVLIALAKRAEFEADHGTMDGGIGGWFWHMVHNLGLDEYTDSIINRQKGLALGVIRNAVEVFLYRAYNADGKGGLFPLVRPQQDQRNVELWYQLNAYLMEGNYVEI